MSARRARARAVGVGLGIVLSYGLPMVGIMAVSQASERADAARMANFNPAVELDTSQVVAGPPVVWRCYAAAGVAEWSCTDEARPFPGDLVFQGAADDVQPAWEMWQALSQIVTHVTR